MESIVNFIKTNNIEIFTGAEIGVYIGTDAEYFLENISTMKLMYLIDPYINYTDVIFKGTILDNEKVDYNVFGKDLMENPLEAKEMASIKLNRFNDRIKWIEKMFELCSKEDISNILDFIYIDGNHQYNYVKKDIELARQFVRKGGVISGHDYVLGGVRRAVDEIDECFNDGAFWWFVNKQG